VPVKVRDLLKILERDGWFLIRTRGSREETLDRMREALSVHIEGMRLHGEVIPEPRAESCLVAVAA
jgi:predicted RNase H-like HicB family nuclease